MKGHAGHAGLAGLAGLEDLHDTSSLKLRSAKLALLS